MDKTRMKSPSDLEIESIKISYQNVEAEDEAKSLHDEIHKQLGLITSPPTRIPDRIAGLGVAEILITITLAPFVQYAVNFVLNALRDFLRKRKPCNGQIVIKLDYGDLGKRFPFRIGVTVWEGLFESVQKHVSNAKKKSISDLIEMRVKIDEEIRRLFDSEATFLGIGILSSNGLCEEEQDLVTSVYTFEQYHKYVQERITENKGIVLGVHGGDVMARFAAPCDAICCASAILRDREEFNKNRNKLKAPLQFRIGIHTGSALTSAEGKEGKVFSKNALDLARHIQEAAEPGTFLLSEHTWRRLEDRKGFQRVKHIDLANMWAYISFAQTSSETPNA